MSILKPKILYTTADASPQSGAFLMLLYTAQGVAARGYRVSLALSGRSRGRPGLPPTLAGRSYFLNLPTLKSGQSFWFYLRFGLRTLQGAFQLARIIRRERITIVHVNEIFDFYGPLAARLAGARCVWHIRADLSPWPVLQRLLPRAAVLLAHTVVTVSESVREQEFIHQGVKADKVCVLYEAPDGKRYHARLDGRPLRKEFGVADDGFLVVLVAKLVSIKGHRVLIEAAPAVLTAFPQSTFLIVGGELDGAHHQDYARHIKALPLALGIQDSVVFAGFRPDVPAIMAAADVVCHCATYPDPFPSVVLQGMAAGKPVVASATGGTREQIVNDVNGLLVEANNPPALAEALCALLGDGQKRAAMGRAAAEHVRARFGPEAFFAALGAIYAGRNDANAPEQPERGRLGPPAVRRILKKEG